MANLASNPWSFATADVVVSVPTVITLNADGTVSVTTAGAHGLVAGNGATLIGNTPAAYNGYYFVLTAPTTTTLILVPQFSIAAGTGAGSVFGNVAKNLYNAYVRIEDLSWQNASAAGQLLDIRDRNGNILWQATATAAGSQNRGKLFWCNGITPINIQSGVVIATIN
jgi:hypothetical protein